MLPKIKSGRRRIDCVTLYSQIRSTLMYHRAFTSSLRNKGTKHWYKSHLHTTHYVYEMEYRKKGGSLL